MADFVIASDRASLRHAIALLKRRGKIPKRPRRAPIVHPKKIERAYARELGRVADYAIQLVRMRVLPQLAHLLRKDGMTLADASGPLARTLDEVQIVFGARTSGSGSSAARDAAAATSAESKRQVQKSTRVALGIQPEFSEPWLREESEAFVRRNVRLITKVGEAVFDKVERTVDDGLRRGLRVEQIARSIEKALPEIGDEAERRAMLIARDQIGSFFGDLNKRRHEDLGVEKYVWSTSRDERVRPSHVEREGHTFRYDEPIEGQLEDQGLEVDTIDGHPGIPIQCRCVALPVLDDLLD